MTPALLNALLKDNPYAKNTELPTMQYVGSPKDTLKASKGIPQIVPEESKHSKLISNVAPGINHI